MLYPRSTVCPGKGYPENYWGVKAAVTAGGIRHKEKERLNQRCSRKRPKHNNLKSIHRRETKAECFQATLQKQVGRRGTEMVAQLSRWCSPSAACAESLPSASTFKTD